MNKERRWRKTKSIGHEQIFEHEHLHKRNPHHRVKEEEKSIGSEEGAERPGVPIGGQRSRKGWGLELPVAMGWVRAPSGVRHGGTRRSEGGTRRQHEGAATG